MFNFQILIINSTFNTSLNLYVKEQKLKPTLHFFIQFPNVFLFVKKMKHIFRNLLIN